MEPSSTPREARFVRTRDGLVVLPPLGLGAQGSLADVHCAASAIEVREPEAVPAVAGVVVHSEP